jgi:membrane protein
MRRRILSTFNHVVGAPETELTRIQKRLRYAFELISHCRTELARVRAEGMAAELTYRTIFSLIPVVVLALVMFRVVGGLDDVQAKVEDQLYSFFGVPDVPDVYTDDIDDPLEDAEGLSKTYQPLSQKLNEIAVAPDAAGDKPNDAPNPSGVANGEALTETEAATKSTESKQQVRASIRLALQDATEKVSNLDFASLGMIGLAFFVYTAVTLASAVEHLFNIVFESPAARPIHIRLAIHWSIITLGGALLVMSLYMSGQFVDYMGGVVGTSNFNRFLNHGVSTLASWVLLFLLYALMPNTQVSVRAAAIGAMVSASLWEAAKFGFQIYVAKAVPYSALYGSLGLIPLFLFWVYVTWMIVLFGLVLTRTLQTLHGRNPTRLRIPTENLPNGDPDWMLPIMAEVSKAFASGHAIDLQEIVERLQLPGTIVHPMMNRLEEAGFVRRVATTSGREDRVTLAKPAEMIRVAEILDVAHHRPEGMNDSRWRLLDKLNQAQIEAAGARTLADVSAA